MNASISVLGEFKYDVIGLLSGYNMLEIFHFSKMRYFLNFIILFTIFVGFATFCNKMGTMCFSTIIVTMVLVDCVHICCMSLAVGVFAGNTAMSHRHLGHSSRRVVSQEGGALGGGGGGVGGAIWRNTVVFQFKIAIPLLF